MSDHIAGPGPDLYTSAEVAALFRVTSLGTVQRWARAGRLGRFLRPGGRDYRFFAINVHHALLGGGFDQEGNPI